MNRFVAPVALAVAVATAVPAAQTIYRVSTAVVSIDAAVSDGRRAVTRLTKDDFELKDNGVVQQVLDFDRAELPIDVTMTIDLSGSMTRDKRAAVERAIAQVSDTLTARDRGAVLAFSRTVTEIADLQPPPIKADISAIGAGTSIYDALLLSIVAPYVADRRQLMIFMTDGDDNASSFDEQTVLDTARNVRGQVSFVIVGRDGDAPVKRAFQSIASLTGGEVINIETDERLSAAFLGAFEAFRTSYLLRYTPTGVVPGGWHEVSVRVKGKNYDVRARRGYTSN